MKKFRDISEASKMKGKDPCWKGYEMVGTKEKGGKTVPNCVPTNEEKEFKKEWSKTGKEASHRETGEKTYEYQELGHDGKPTGKREYRNAQGKSMGESVELAEGKMGELHADLSDHLDKHIANYKKVGGAEHFGHKTTQVASKIAKLHGIEQKHAQKFVNDYVETKLKEEVVEEQHAEAGKFKPVKPKSVSSASPRPSSDSVNVKGREKDGVPFDPPYTKARKMPIVDKSGAKHGPMSVARDLARTAAQKFAKSLAPQSKLKESRKAEIVKDAAKKGKMKDAFQAEPELSNSKVTSDVK